MTLWMYRIRMWRYMFASRFHMYFFMHRRQVLLSGLLMALAAVMGVGFWGWIVWPRPAVCTGVMRAQACGLMEQGRYDDALADIEAHLKREPGAKNWRGLKDMMLKEMTVDFHLQYLSGGKLPVKRAQSGKLVLSPSDKYYYVVNPSESCHLYLFQINSGGELLQLFPNPANSGTRNPMAPGRQLIPAAPVRLELKPKAGEERVILVAARWAIPEFEPQALKALGDKDAARRRETFQRFLERVANENRNTDRLGGLVFGEARFRNSGL